MSVLKKSLTTRCKKGSPPELNRTGIVLYHDRKRVLVRPFIPSNRILFPSSPTEVNGIEDARFVLFQNEDASKIYYATYTAYDGKCILPQPLETHDFLHFKFNTLNGPAVQNKGMALFPLTMCSQQWVKP